MSGSIQKFVYTDDSGYKKIINLDESNTRQLGYTPATVLSVAALGIPSRVSKLNGKERYVLMAGVTSGGRPVRRKLIVPEADNAYFATGGGFSVIVDVATGTAETVVMQVTRAVGEAKSFALLGTDTGLDDGTQP
jgi:hypothetical protein